MVFHKKSSPVKGVLLMYHPPLTWSERGQLWLRLGIRLVLVLLAALALKLLLRPALSLFAPFVAAFVAAAVLNLLVRWVQKRLGWSRKLLSLLVLLLLLGLLGGVVSLLVYGVGAELVSLAQNWEGLFAQVTQVLHQIEGVFAWLQSLIPAPITQATQSLWTQLSLWVQENASLALTAAAEFATSKAVKLPSFLLALVMFVLATYFLTADYPYLRTRIIQHMDDRSLHFFSQVRTTALVAFGGYLRAQALLSVGVFFILLAGFLFTRQSYALLLALGLAVLDFIPIVGAGTVMVPWALVALFTRDYFTAAAILIIWGIIAVFRRFAEPKIVGDQTGLSPILSLVSMYAGMKLAGVPGMILGPILTLVVLNLAGIGVFGGVRRDISAAAEDIWAILAQRTQPSDP